MNKEGTIRHLVEECAVDIDATTFYNLSPVMLAFDKRYNRIVEYLVQCGADRSDLDCSEVEDDSDSSEDVEVCSQFECFDMYSGHYEGTNQETVVDGCVRVLNPKRYIYCNTMMRSNNIRD
jgi:hypothetical protein